MDDLQDISVPTEPADARRDMLVSQLEAAEPTSAPDSEPEAPAKPRASDGKFVAANAAASDVSHETSNEPELPVWERAPGTWKTEKHAVWAAMSPEAKEYAWHREEQTRVGIEPLRSKAEFADRMQQAIAPYEQIIRGLGVEPVQAVQALMQADHTLRTAPYEQKRAYLAQLAAGYGIDLTGVEQYSTNAPVDPMVFTLQNELANIRGEVLGWKQQQEQAQSAVLASEINSFAAKAEFFEDAKPAMIQLLQSGLATTLDDAYDKATRLDPDLFDRIHSAQQAKTDSERKLTADRAAKLAKAAAVSVKSSTPGTVTPTNAQDRRSMLLEQFDGLSERF